MKFRNGDRVRLQHGMHNWYGVRAREDASRRGKVVVEGGVSRYGNEACVVRTDDDKFRVSDADFLEHEPRETITIGNRTYDKAEVEEALRDVRSLD